MDDLDRTEEVTEAAQRFAQHQGANGAEVVSVIDLLAPGVIGAHYGVAILARWPSSGFHQRLRAFVAVQRGGQWWWLGLSDLWLQLVAKEA